MNEVAGKPPRPGALLTGLTGRAEVFHRGLNGTAIVAEKGREDKGYTYGARSRFSGSDYRGPYSASATVKSKVTDSTIVQFMKEIENFKAKGIT